MTKSERKIHDEELNDLETVEIRDDPLQIANNKSRIINTAQLRFHTSKLSTSSTVSIHGFIIRGLRWILSSIWQLRQIFKRGILIFVNSLV